MCNIILLSLYMKYQRLISKLRVPFQYIHICIRYPELKTADYTVKAFISGFFFVYIFFS